MAPSACLPTADVSQNICIVAASQTQWPMFRQPPQSLKSQVTVLWIFSIQPFMKLQEAEMTHILF